MKKLMTGGTSVFAILTLVTALVFAGCDSPAQKAETSKEDDITRAQEDLDNAREAYKAEVAKFKMEHNQRIAANERVIEGLKADMKNSKKEVKAAYKDQVAAMEKRNAELKKELDEYNDDTMNSWQSFKAEFSEDMNQLGKAFSDFTVKD
jgi:Skp family chaperone for outer membrane proteins